MSTGHQLDIIQILWEASIVVKLDLLLLVLASIVSWGIIFRKISFFKSVSSRNDNFLRLFESSNTMTAVYDDSINMEDSPFRDLFIEGYEEFNKLRDANNGDLVLLRQHYADFGVLSLERALKSGMTKVEEEAGDSLTTLASIGSITPFVGLFGTVWGIIDSFASLAQGGATLETVAPGIAEALVATAIGLVAAIPATWYYNKFGSRKAKLKESMINFSEKFINEVERVLASKTHR